MKGLLLIFFFAFVIGTVSAQDNQAPAKKSTVFVELAGNGGLYSINYDHIVLGRPSWKLAGRIGAMYYREKLNYLENNYSQKVAVPVELSYLRGKENHYLELGLGITPWHENYKDFHESQINQVDLLPYTRLGYRYQKRDGGIFFKAGLTPMVKLKNNQNQNFPWGGLAIGYTL